MWVSSVINIENHLKCKTLVFNKLISWRTLFNLKNINMFGIESFKTMLLTKLTYYYIIPFAITKWTYSIVKYLGFYNRKFLFGFLDKIFCNYKHHSSNIKRTALSLSLSLSTGIVVLKRLSVIYLKGKLHFRGVFI